MVDKLLTSNNNFIVWYLLICLKIFFDYIINSFFGVQIFLLQVKQIFQVEKPKIKIYLQELYLPIFHHILVSKYKNVRQRPHVDQKLFCYFFIQQHKLVILSVFFERQEDRFQDLKSFTHTTSETSTMVLHKDTQF